MADDKQIDTTQRNDLPTNSAPPSDVRKTDVHETIRSIMKFRKGRPLGGGSIRDMIDEGRR